MGTQPINEYTGAKAHQEVAERNVIYGSEDLLRALCRNHRLILAHHERAGRTVRWLA